MRSFDSPRFLEWLTIWDGRSTSDDFGDGNDMVASAYVDFIVISQFVAIICKGRDAFSHPHEDGNFGSLILLSMVVEKKSCIQYDETRVGGNEYTVYSVPNDSTTDIISLLQMRFGLVSKYLILWHVECFRSDVGFDIRTMLWFRCSTKHCLH